MLEQRTFGELVAAWQDCNRDFDCFAYPGQHEGQGEFKYYTATDLGNLTRNAAEHFVSQGLQPRQEGERPLVVAIFALGTPEWAASFFAIARMGHTVIVMNPRLLSTYADQLLELSKADFVVTDKPLKDLPEPLRLISIPTSQLDCQLGLSTTKDKGLFGDPSVVKEDDHAYANHSSGSTSCPKLLHFTHKQVMESFRLTNGAYPPGKRRWFASAFYNTVGLRALIVSLWATAPMFFENDRIAFTANTVVQFAREAKVDQMFLTPHTFTLLSSTQEGVKEMVRTDFVSCFGAVVSDDVGDRLVAEGGTVGMQYGMTETMMTLWSTGRSADDRKEWAWLEKVPTKKKWLEMRPIDGQEGYYELVCLPGCPDVLEIFKEEEGSFKSGDVFQRHPTNPERWKIVGRKDDQIKIYQDDRQVVVNANVYENKISNGNEDIISEVVLFGQGRHRLGVLVFTDADINEVEECIWKTIERDINGKLSVGIDKDMIVVIEKERSDLPQTGKYNLIRSRIYVEYEAQIERAYHILVNI